MPVSRPTSSKQRGYKIDRNHNIHAICQYPNCPFASEYYARRLEFGWYDLCPKHMAIFREMSLGDIRTTVWDHPKVIKL